MAFAPALVAPPSPEDQDRAAVADAIDEQALGASRVLPPEPLPAPVADLPPDALMAAAAAPPPAVPLTPVDAALAPMLPPDGGPALSVLPPPEAAPGAPAAPVSDIDKRRAEVEQETVANATEKAQLDAQAAEEKAKLAADREAAFTKLQERQETHRQAAETRVSEARAKAASEPYHTFWESRSIGQNIATGIGLILGGISWNPAHVNRGVALLENMMQQDLQLQKDKHADLWKAVDSAEKGEAALDSRQLHEVAEFTASRAAKADALASRLAAAVAMNKGKGDITEAKKQIIKWHDEAEKNAALSAHASATANHLKQMDEETKLRDEAHARAADEANRIRLIRAEKYKTKGGGTGGGGGHAREAASLELKDKIGEFQKSGLKGIDLDKAIDREAVRLKIPLTGKPNTLNARQIKQDLFKEAGAASKAEHADLVLSEKDAARTLHWKGQEWLAPRANQVKDYAKDIANLEKYNDLIHEVASDIDKNGFIVDPGGEDNPQTAAGKLRMSSMAELQALGRQISALQATDAGQKLEHQMIGHAGVGFKPGIASSSTLRELGTRANKLIDTKFRAGLTPVKKEGGGASDDAMRGAAERLTSGKSQGSDAAKKKAQEWLDSHPKKADITL